VFCLQGSAERATLKTRECIMASANLEDQTLHLTVRLQAGEEEEEEEEEEIGGLINSDGEVVEWDASKCFLLFQFPIEFIC